MALIGNIYKEIRVLRTLLLFFGGRTLLLYTSKILSCRQEKLEHMAEKFTRKSSLRETWLIDMTQILDELDNGRDAHSVDAALKRQEAIHTDVTARVSCAHVYVRTYVLSQISAVDV